MVEEQKVERCPRCGAELDENIRSLLQSEATFCPRKTCGVQLTEDDGGNLRIRTFRLNNHYSYCVLPFAFFHFEGENCFEDLRRSSRWEQKIFSMDDPDDVERTEYFLPYVKRFLFPSLFRKDVNSPEYEPTCQHFHFDLSLLGGSREDGLPLTMRCENVRKKVSYDYDLKLSDIELLVFNYRVAFLNFRFEHTSPMATYFDQMDATHFFRLIAPLYREFQMPEFAAGDKQFYMSQLLPYLLAEFDKGSRPPAHPSDLDKDSELPVQVIYDDRMMVYTFSCINRKMTLNDLARAENLLERDAIVNLNPDLKTNPPGPGEGDEEKDWLRQRWQGLSKEGATLVVFDIDRFHSKYLGEYNSSYYMDIFLLATLQRVTLLLLFERLSDIEGLTSPSWGSGKALRRLRKDLLMFKNQSWFSQISNRERGLVLWRRWQNVFENKMLLEEVNEQSKELDAYLQNRTREKIEWGMRLGGFMATAIPAIFGLELLLGKAPWVASLRWVLISILILGSGVFAWFVFFGSEDT